MNENKKRRDSSIWLQNKLTKEIKKHLKEVKKKQNKYNQKNF